MATALGWLLRDHDARMAVSETPSAVRVRLDQLCGEGILELEHGGYRTSQIARYSSYQLPLPAARLSTDKHPGRITDIHPDFH